MSLFVVRGEDLLLGREQHHHIASFPFRGLLEFRDGFEILRHAVEEGFSKVGVLDFPAPERDRGFDLIPRFEETNRIVNAHLVIVFFNFVAHLHFFHIGGVLLFASFPRFFLLFKLVFAVIHNPTDGGIGLVTDEDEIKLPFFGKATALFGSNDAHLAAIGINDANLRVADTFVNLR